MNDDAKKAAPAAAARPNQNSVFSELKIPGDIIRSMDDRVFDRALKQAESTYARQLKARLRVG